VSLRGRLGCVLLIAYPVVEIALAVLIANVIGWWWLLVYAVVCIVLGLGLVRYALSATGRSFGVAMSGLRADSTDAVVAIEGPARSVPTPPARTLLIVPAGLLIAVPGVLTTLLGLILWLPPVRDHIAARIERAARRLG
jgi:UPF0716 protein FxsA